MRKRYLIVSDTHYCHETEYNQLRYGNITNDEKAARIIAQIEKEYKREKYEMIFFLGDYSLDHWWWDTKGSYLTRGVSYTEIFVKKYLQNLPAPYIMIPGNHEQFGEEMWKKITGMGRTNHAVDGDFLFIFWDSYGADLDPTEHSDGTYTPIDIPFVRGLMDQYPDKKVILLSHYFVPNGTKEESELIADDRVVCMFQGHTHEPRIDTLPDAYKNKKLIHAGGWSHLYPGVKEPWGMRDIVIEDGVLTSHFFTEDYTYENGGQQYHIEERIYAGIEIPFEK